MGLTRDVSTGFSSLGHRQVGCGSIPETALLPYSSSQRTLLLCCLGQCLQQHTLTIVMGFHSLSMSSVQRTSKPVAGWTVCHQLEAGCCSCGQTVHIRELAGKMRQDNESFQTRRLSAHQKASVHQAVQTRIVSAASSLPTARGTLM